MMMMLQSDAEYTMQGGGGRQAGERLYERATTNSFCCRGETVDNSPCNRNTPTFSCGNISLVLNFITTCYPAISASRFVKKSTHLPRSSRRSSGALSNIHSHLDLTSHWWHTEAKCAATKQIIRNPPPCPNFAPDKATAAPCS